MHTNAVATVADATVASPVVDLATDNLPAVDTPDACDKAALRYDNLKIAIFPNFLI